METNVEDGAVKVEDLEVTYGGVTETFEVFYKKRRFHCWPPKGGHYVSATMHHLKDKLRQAVNLTTKPKRTKRIIEVSCSGVRVMDVETSKSRRRRYREVNVEESTQSGIWLETYNPWGYEYPTAIYEVAYTPLRKAKLDQFKIAADRLGRDFSSYCFDRVKAKRKNLQYIDAKKLDAADLSELIRSFCEEVENEAFS